MPKEINSDLLRGNINTIILSALYSGDRYGYEIVNEIEQKSRGQYHIGVSSQTAEGANIFRLQSSAKKFLNNARTITNIRVPS